MVQNNKISETTGFQSDTSKLLIIEARSGWQTVDWQELWHYREILYILLWREWKAQYAQTVLGIGWAIIRPVFSLVIFTILFGNMLQVNSDGVPYAAFFCAAIIPWNYFSNALSEVSTSLRAGINLISKVYFPHILLPIQAVLKGLLEFSVTLIVVFAIMVWFRIVPTVWIVFLPFLILLMIFTALGLGMFVAALAVQYRDITYLFGYTTTALLYLSPVIYPTSLIPEQYRLFYAMNPMVGVIEGFRSALLSTNPMPWDLLAVGTFIAILLFVGGLFIFLRMERGMVDVA